MRSCVRMRSTAWRSSRSDATNARGFGLGLAIARRAIEALMAFLADDLNNGRAPAGYERSAEVVALSVEIDHEDAREAACRTFKDAALDLKVSAPRITALVKAGKLDVELVDGRRMITIDSIERYAAQERHAGRPKKFVAVQ